MRLTNQSSLIVVHRHGWAHDELIPRPYGLGANRHIALSR
jgi:hypothetical protein